MSAIEAELVKIFKFKKTSDDFEDHQEYLKELASCVEKIKDEKVWDTMQEETYEWLTEAVESVNKKRVVPDFPDAEPEEAEATNEDEDLPLTDPRHPLHRPPPPQKENDEENEADADEEDEPDEADADEEDEPDEADEPGEEEVEGKVEEDPEAVDPGSQPLEEEKADDEVPAKKPRKKHVKAGKYIKKLKGKPDIQPKHKPGKEPNYKKITGTKDRYNITEGTKASLALKMFEKGCTMRDVVIELGDTQYNVLRKLAKQGHSVEKMKNGVITLTHKDDLAKKGKGK
jgi:hypothetical protein